MYIIIKSHSCKGGARVTVKVCFLNLPTPLNMVFKKRSYFGGHMSKVRVSVTW